MTRAKTLSVCCFSAFLFFLPRAVVAQVVTNRTFLQQASQQRAAQELAFRKILISTAQQKGWPLTLHMSKGRTANLRGINGRGLPVYITTTDNIISAATIRTSSLWPGGASGLALNGGSNPNMKGQIAIWDEGVVRPTHVELVGRVVQEDASSGDVTLQDHSTHVAGTMIATGVNPVAKGMAFGAQLLQAYDYNNDESEMMAAAAKGLLVSNHSYANITGWNYDSGNGHWEFWGQPGDTVDINFGLYDADAQTWDNIAYNAPLYLIAKAAGNNRGETGPPVGQTYYRMNASGNFYNAGARPSTISSNDSYETISTYGCAKNILCIGAVNPIPGGYHLPSDVVMADFSSWGPTGDGRIKPDLVADGVNVLSSISTSDNAYDIYSGTSMATPASAGSSFLLQEYYTKLHGATKFMRSATLKGLLIHTADEAGTAPGPDYQFGWGLINMERAAGVITSDNTDHSQQIFENQLVNGTHNSDTVTITASGKTPVWATICWTDPPGVPANIPNNESNFQDTGIKLINDLDLRIVDSNTNKVYMPWILNPNNRPAAATKGDNIRDNVEKVEISDTIVPGHVYKIIVTHKGTFSASSGSQAYSLLVSGGGGSGYCTSTSSGAQGTMIKSVAIGSVTNTNSTGCKTYSDFTALAPFQLPLGQTMSFNINLMSCSLMLNNTNLAVYIDYNNNGSFGDPGELVYSSNNLAAGSGGKLVSGSFTVPATAVVGSYTRMRIITEDGNGGTPAPCGPYTSGETQDYKVTFINPSNDVGVTTLEYPTLTTCASDSQIVSVRIRNFGTVPQTSVPVTTVIRDAGNNTVASLSAVCMDSIAAGTEVVFTYNTTFKSVAGTSYTFTSSTALAADGNSANNTNTSTIAVNSAGAAPVGTVSMCSQDATQALLKTTTTGNDIAFWYTNPAADSLLAEGDSVVTKTIPANQTYYLGVNRLTSKAGPPNKLALAGGKGAYFRMYGNFMQFTTSVPLTLESAKMYFGHSGQVTFTLATLAGAETSDGGYSYYPISTTTIDVAATIANPDTAYQINVNAGDNTDTGATYLLNIPVPQPGSYILIIESANYASPFLSVYSGSSSSALAPYPFTIPGIISITGNDMRFNPNNAADSVNYYKHFYFPFYNLGIRLNGCPQPVTAIAATIPPQPVISLNGSTLTSNVVNGNLWLRNNLDYDSTSGQTLKLKTPGVYQSIVNDSSIACLLKSNKVVYNTGSDLDGNTIALTVAPNPNPGVFQLSFYFSTAATTSIELEDLTGKQLYVQTLSNFQGQFNQTMDMPALASGIYVLKILRGDTKYIKRIFIRRN